MNHHHNYTPHHLATALERVLDLHKRNRNNQKAEPLAKPPLSSRVEAVLRAEEKKEASPLPIIFSQKKPSKRLRNMGGKGTKVATVHRLDPFVEMLEEPTTGRSSEVESYSLSPRKHHKSSRFQIKEMINQLVSKCHCESLGLVKKSTPRIATVPGEEKKEFNKYTSNLLTPRRLSSRVDSEKEG